MDHIQHHHGYKPPHHPGQPHGAKMTGTKDGGYEYKMTHEAAGGMYLKTYSSQPFLFHGWNLMSVEGLVITLLVATALTVIREVIACSLNMEAVTFNAERANGIISRSSRLRRTLLHMFHAAIAYTLMLCVMTYNVWLFAAVAVGAGIGYFFLCPVIFWTYNRSLNLKLRQKIAADGPAKRKLLIGQSCTKPTNEQSLRLNHIKKSGRQKHEPFLKKYVNGTDRVTSV